MAAILNLAILDSAILVFLLKLTHTCQDWFPPFAQKNFTHSFWLNLMMAAILKFCNVGSRHCHLGFRHLVIFSQIHSKTLSVHSDSDSNLFYLTQTHTFLLILVMEAILNLAILDSAILVFPPKLTHNCQNWFPPFAHKNFTHSFWLILMMAAILNSVTLVSDTVILDSDTLLSSLRFTQKHSHSTLTLNQTNSIWLKLIHSHLTWWWQPFWIPPPWIQPS